MIEAVVFDFDGLIRNTETFEYYSYRELLLEHGVELPLELYCTRIGGDSAAFDPYFYLETTAGITIDREALRSLRRQKYELLIKDELTRPGVMQYLESARRLGLHIGLASSAPYSWIGYNLEELNLSHYFDYICTMEDVEKVKPDPALYIKGSISVFCHPALSLLRIPLTELERQCGPTCIL
jgi:beta-phosphoglucomutase-like phosphatase (HAD superfamily)